MNKRMRKKHATVFDQMALLAQRRGLEAGALQFVRFSGGVTSEATDVGTIAKGKFTARERRGPVQVSGTQAISDDGTTLSWTVR